MDGLWAQQFENRAVATVIGIRNADQAGTKHLKPTSQQAQARLMLTVSTWMLSLMLSQQCLQANVVQVRLSCIQKLKAAMEKASMLATDADPATGMNILVTVACCC